MLEKLEALNELMNINTTEEIETGLKTIHLAIGISITGNDNLFKLIKDGR